MNRLGVTAGVGIVPAGLATTAAMQSPQARVDVRQFGATGDGQSDDSRAIQRALEADSGAIFFPRGSYLLKRSVQIDLQNRGCTSIAGDGTARILMAGTGPAFRFLGTHDKTADPAGVDDRVWERQRLPLVSGLEIRGLHEHSVGIQLEGTMQATLTALLLRRLRIGIHCLTRNRNLLIDHCHIYDNREMGIFFDHVNLHQSILSANHISYNPAAGVCLRDGEVRNFQLVGNDIEYNYRVDREGSADVLIDMSGGGTFREATIVGNTIQARPSPGGANLRMVGGEELKSGGMTAVTGNLIGSQNDNLHLVNCRGVSITGNSIYSAAARSLAVRRSSNITFSGNSIDWNPDHRGKRMVDGITIRDCDGVAVSGSIIENSFQGSKESGGTIEIDGSQHVSVNNCQVLDPRYRGIVVRDSQRCRVDGCTVVDRRPTREMLASIQVSGETTRDNALSNSTVTRGTLAIDSSTGTLRSGILET